MRGFQKGHTLNRGRLSPFRGVVRSIRGDGTRVCSTCNLPKSLSEFSPKKYSGDTIYFRSECKGCNAEAGREWRKNNPEKAKAAVYRWNAKNKQRVKFLLRKRALKRYGLDPEQFDELIQKQDGKCANPGCARKLSIGGRSGSSASIDHDHKTGKLRAILCQACNVALGRLREDQSVILGLGAYLKHHAEIHGTKTEV